MLSHLKKSSLTLVIIFFYEIPFSINSYSYSLTLKEYNSIKENWVNTAEGIGPHCDDGANPAWAKIAIGADLADEFLAEKFAQIPVTENSKIHYMSKVGVVDSGFDSLNYSNLIDIFAGFEVKKAIDQAGEPSKDFDGHGTPVTSLIGGKNFGITKYVKLTSYRITSAFANGSALSQQLDDAILNACTTNDIVNVSWGSILDDLVIAKYDTANWYQYSLKKPCLVIKAAGNGGNKFKNNKLGYSDESPLITVSSTNQYSLESDFSTSGSIAAPGEQVYAFLSKSHDYSSATMGKICHKLNPGSNTDSDPLIGPVNGTSFSSPILAGVAAQVLAVLRVNRALPTSPIKRASFIKKILRLSASWSTENRLTPGMVNAYVAVKLANGIKYTNKSGFTPLNLDNLLKNLNSPNDCNNTVCEKTETLNEKVKCVNQLRKQLYLCKNSTMSKASLIQIKDLLVELGEKEQLPLLIAVNTKNEKKNSDINNTPNSQNPEDKKNSREEQHLLDLWNEHLTTAITTKDVQLSDKKTTAQKSNITQQNINDFELAIDIVALAKKIDFKAFFTLEKFQQLLRSPNYSFNANKLDRSSSIPNNGEDIKFQLVLDFFSRLSEKDQILFLKKPFQNFEIDNNNLAVYWNATSLESAILAKLNFNKKNLLNNVSIELTRALNDIFTIWNENRILSLGVTKYNSRLVWITTNTLFIDQLYLNSNQTCENLGGTLKGEELIKINDQSYPKVLHCLLSKITSPNMRNRITKSFINFTEKKEILNSTIMAWNEKTNININYSQIYWNNQNITNALQFLADAILKNLNGQIENGNVNSTTITNAINDFKKISLSWTYTRLTLYPNKNKSSKSCTTLWNEKTFSENLLSNYSMALKNNLNELPLMPETLTQIINRNFSSIFLENNCMDFNNKILNHEKSLHAFFKIIVEQLTTSAIETSVLNKTQNYKEKIKNLKTRKSEITDPEQLILIDKEIEKYDIELSYLAILRPKLDSWRIELLGMVTAILQQETELRKNNKMESFKIIFKPLLDFQMKNNPKWITQFSKNELYDFFDLTEK